MGSATGGDVVAFTLRTTRRDDGTRTMFGRLLHRSQFGRVLAELALVRVRFDRGDRGLLILQGPGDPISVPVPERRGDYVAIAAGFSAVVSGAAAYNVMRRAARSPRAGLLATCGSFGTRPSSLPPQHFRRPLRQGARGRRVRPTPARRRGSRRRPLVRSRSSGGDDPPGGEPPDEPRAARSGRLHLDDHRSTPAVARASGGHESRTVTTMLPTIEQRSKAGRAVP